MEGNFKNYNSFVKFLQPQVEILKCTVPHYTYPKLVVLAFRTIVIEYAGDKVAY